MSLGGFATELSRGLSAVIPLHLTPTEKASKSGLGNKNESIWESVLLERHAASQSCKRLILVRTGMESTYQDDAKVDGQDEQEEVGSECEQLDAGISHEPQACKDKPNQAKGQYPAILLPET
jgi:hypothetical protein